jgi:hypothetical protein
VKCAGTRGLGRRLEDSVAAAAEQSAAILWRRRAVVGLISPAAKPGEETGIGGLARRHEKTGRQGERRAERARRCES